MRDAQLIEILSSITAKKLTDAFNTATDTYCQTGLLSSHQKKQKAEKRIPTGITDDNALCMLGNFLNGPGNSNLPSLKFQLIFALFGNLVRATRDELAPQYVQKVKGIIDRYSHSKANNTLHNGFMQDDERLYNAIMQDDEKAIKALFESGAYSSKPEKWKQACKNWHQSSAHNSMYDPLLLAVSRYKTKAIKALLDYGINPEYALKKDLKSYESPLLHTNYDSRKGYTSYFDVMISHPKYIPSVNINFVIYRAVQLNQKLRVIQLIKKVKDSGLLKKHPDLLSRLPSYRLLTKEENKMERSSLYHAVIRRNI